MLINIVDIVPSENEDMWFWLRRTRNRLLAQSDWTQISDSPLSDEQKQAWVDYRQALRDLPSTLITITESVDFPDPPE